MERLAAEEAAEVAAAVAEAEELERVAAEEAEAKRLTRAFTLASIGDLAELRPLIIGRQVAVDVIRPDGLFRGYTLLHAAASKGHVEVVEYLLSAGASPHVLNAQGKTALMLASDKSHSAVVAIFERAASTNPNPLDAVPSPPTTTMAVPAAMAAPTPREAMSGPPTPAHGTPPSAPQQPPAPPPPVPNGTPPDLPPAFAELDVPGGPASLPPSHRHSTNLGFAREVERLHVGAPVMRAAEANRRLLHELAQRASAAPSSLSSLVEICRQYLGYALDFAPLACGLEAPCRELLSYASTIGAEDAARLEADFRAYVSAARLESPPRPQSHSPPPPPPGVCLPIPASTPAKRSSLAASPPALPVSCRSSSTSTAAPSRARPR